MKEKILVDGPANQFGRLPESGREHIWAMRHINFSLASLLLMLGVLGVVIFPIWSKGVRKRINIEGARQCNQNLESLFVEVELFKLSLTETQLIRPFDEHDILKMGRYGSESYVLLSGLRWIDFEGRQTRNDPFVIMMDCLNNHPLENSREFVQILLSNGVSLQLTMDSSEAESWRGLLRAGKRFDNTILQ